MSTSVVQVLSYEGRAECDGCEHYVLRTVSEGAALDAAGDGDPREAVRAIVLRDALAAGFRHVRGMGGEILLCRDCMCERRAEGEARAVVELAAAVAAAGEGAAVVERVS